MGKLSRWFQNVGGSDGSGQEALPVRMSYEIANLQGQGDREYQEDSFAFVNALDVTAIREEGLLAVLADGMGGMEDGKAVSTGATQCLTADFATMDRNRDLGEQLKDSLHRINDWLYRQFGGRGGTTVIACIFFQEQLYFASVGDSYLFLKRDNGLYRLNREQNCLHQMYMEQIEDGILEPERAGEDEDAHRLSQFVGMDRLTDIDYTRRPFPLRSGDVILNCSDGIGGVLDERTIFRCLCADSAKESCRLLEREIIKAGKRHQDNYTALVISCKY